MMKLKALHLLQLYVEKIVLAIGATFFLIVVWSYTVGNPYAVSIGDQEGVGPEEVEKEVLEHLVALAGAVDDASPSPLPEISVPAYTAVFQQRITRGLLPVSHFDPLEELGVVIAQPDRVAGDIWRVPAPPAPVGVAVRAGFGVLLDPQQLADELRHWANRAAPLVPHVADAVEAYDRLVARGQPRDFRYVSIGARFDAASWRAMRLQSGGIPPDWWESAMAVTDVVLERQRFDPRTGNWGATTVIAPLPGALSFRDQPKTWAKDKAEQAIRLIKRWQEQVARSPFAPMSQVVSWQPPPLVQEPSEGERQRPIESSDGFEVDAAPPHSTKPGQPPTVRLFELEPQESAPATSIPAGPDRGPQSAKMPGGSPQARAAPGRPERWWNVWAHDLTVRPGETYRYRIRVWLVNPLFQRARLEDGLHEKYFNQLATESLPSDWSDSVTVEPLRRFFVVGGSGVERQATIEVWRVFNGRPRVSEFRVGAGDLIGAVVSITAGGITADVDMSIGAIVVDLIDAPLPGRMGGGSTRMLYYDLGTDELLERTIDTDRRSPIRSRLIKQAAMDASVSRAGDGAVGIE